LLLPVTLLVPRHFSSHLSLFFWIIITGSPHTPSLCVCFLFPLLSCSASSVEFVLFDRWVLPSHFQNQDFRNQDFAFHGRQRRLLLALTLPPPKRQRLRFRSAFLRISLQLIILSTIPSTID
jgi:hypothetical protein